MLISDWSSDVCSSDLLVLGVGLGLLSGYLGGVVDAVIMRIADVQLTFPAILIALLIDGLSRSVLPRELHADIWFYVLVLAIGLSFWVQYARTVRSSEIGRASCRERVCQYV